MIIISFCREKRMALREVMVPLKPVFPCKQKSETRELPTVGQLAIIMAKLAMSEHWVILVVTAEMVGPVIRLETACSTLWIFSVRLPFPALEKVAATVVMVVPAEREDKVVMVDQLAPGQDRTDIRVMAERGAKEALVERGAMVVTAATAVL